MRYTGEARIRFKGNRAIAQIYIPLARTLLGGVVNRDKELGGLDRSVIRRFFSNGLYIEAGYIGDIHYINIDVSRVPQQTQEQQRVGVYVLYPSLNDLLPVATDTPTPIRPALSTKANAVAWRKNELFIADEQLLLDEYQYEPFTSRVAYSTQLDWVSADGAIRLYSDCTASSEYSSFSSKYSLASQESALEGIKHRNNTVRNIRTIGYGIFNGWLIYCRNGVTDNTFGIFTRKVEFIDGRLQVVGSEYTVSSSSSNSQSKTAYGVSSDFNRTTDVFGSYFFNFSPGGDRAVRAVVFNKASAEEAEYKAFKDELFFSMNEAVIPIRPKLDSRVISDGGSILVTTTFTSSSTGTYPNYTTSSSTVAAITGRDLLVACDYAASGVLATLTYRLQEFEYTYNTNGYRNRTVTSVMDEPSLEELGFNRFSYTPQVVHGEASGGSTRDEYHYSTLVLSATAVLVYEADAEHIIPFYSNSTTYDSVYEDFIDGDSLFNLGGVGAYGNGQYTIDAVMFEITPVDGYPATPWREERTEVMTVTQNRSQTHSVSMEITGNGVLSFDRKPVGGVACMDLRNGIFVISTSDLSHTVSASETATGTKVTIITQEFAYLGAKPNGVSSESTDTDITIGGDGVNDTTDIPLAEDMEYGRKDKLYILSPSVTVFGLDLPPVEGINTPGRPIYNGTYANPRIVDPYSDIIYRAPAVSINDLGAFAGDGIKVVGAGGSVAVEPGKSILFSVLGSEYYNEAITNLPAANICKQATYMYEFETSTLRVLTPLLWDSVELEQDPIEPDPVKKEYVQVGVIEFAT